jgi:Cu(I)/Ag(I) efflux system membrane fusion protein
MEAVVVTGERNIVFVSHDDGTLMPHEVTLGGEAAGNVEILSGVREGQTIVASGNFLVDAESRLGALGGSMPGMQHDDEGAAIEPEPAAAGHEGHDHD